MPKAGLEPARACAHCALNAARLPIPPLRRGRIRYPRAHAVVKAGVDRSEAEAYLGFTSLDVSQKPSPGAERRIPVARNPRATHDYHILDSWEAGLVLTGTEVKSLRSGKGSIKEAYARVRNGEVFLEGMNVTPYEQGNRYNHDPVRSRKLLLHRKEINRLIGAVERQGLTLVPLELYFRGGHAKVVIGLGRGKKRHDKREDLKRRDAERDVARALARGRR